MELRARRPSLRGPQEYRILGGAPMGAHGGPRTPERLKQHLPAAGPLYTNSIHEQQQQHHGHPHRIEARGATIGGVLGTSSATAGPFQGAPLLLRGPVAERPQSAAATAGRGAPTGASLQISREGRHQEGPSHTHWREAERQSLRPPAPHTGALRAPPDTPAAAAVLQLEGPPISLSRQMPAEGLLGPPAPRDIPAALPSSGGPQGGPPSSEVPTAPPAPPLPAAPGGSSRGPMGGPSGVRRTLPAFGALAEALAPPPSGSGGPLADVDALKGRGPQSEGPSTISGIFLDAAFPPGAPLEGPQTGIVQQQGPRQILAAVASAAANDMLGALRRGGPPILRLPWTEGCAPEAAMTSQEAEAPAEVAQEQRPAGGPLMGVGVPVLPKHTLEGLRKSKAATVEIIFLLLSWFSLLLRIPVSSLLLSLLFYSASLFIPILSLSLLCLGVAALLRGPPGGPIQGPPVEIDAAASALAIVRLTPATRTAAAAGATAAAAAAANMRGEAAAGTAGAIAVGGALTATAEFLLQVGDRTTVSLCLSCSCLCLSHSRLCLC